MQTVMTLARLLVSLAVVLGLMWVIARRLRKTGTRRGRRQGIEVLERASLSRSASVALVRVHNRTYVLGVADAAVSVLSDITTDLELDGVLDADSADGPVEIDPPRSATDRSPRAEAAPRRPAASPAATAVRVAPRSDASGRGRNIPVAGSHTPAPAQSPRGSHRHGSDTERRSALSGSALSPQTWQQTLNTLRDITARS